MVLAKEKYQLREREIEKLGATFVPFTAQTRMSGVDLTAARSARAPPTPSRRTSSGSAGAFPEEVRAGRGRHRQGGRHPAGGLATGRQGAWRHPAEGHRQGRHPGALRPAPPHGHQDHHDHRRQPAHRGRDQRGGGGGRLPGPGDAGGQAQADPRRPGAGPSGGDDRRRHQRRARAGPGRRGGGHEHRDAGGQGSGQHDRPGLEPHQAPRGGRDRQADADDPRRPHHLQHRQRRGQVLRDHPGRVRHDLSGARRAQRHAPGHAPRARSCPRSSSTP